MTLLSVANSGDSDEEPHSGSALFAGVQFIGIKGLITFKSGGGN